MYLDSMRNNNENPPRSNALIIAGGVRTLAKRLDAKSFESLHFSSRGRISPFCRQVIRYASILSHACRSPRFLLHCLFRLHFLAPLALLGGSCRALQLRNISGGTVALVYHFGLI